MTTENEPAVVALPSAGVPADQGLSSLGLIMQLAGSLFAVITGVSMLTMLLALSHGNSDIFLVFALLGLSTLRSVFHRVAGSEILYGRRTFDPDNADPLAGLKRYIGFAFIHSAAIAFLMKVKFGAPGGITIGVALGLAAWPALLAGLFFAGSFKRFQRAVPVAEDKGFEAAAILMTVFGVCGVIGTGGILVFMLDQAPRAFSQGPGPLLLLALVMLVIRSVLHVQAGLSGLRSTSVDRAVELANRYSNFGVISSFCAGGVFFIIAMKGGGPAGLIYVVMLCWMLMSWPLIIRRFFSERQFADLLAGDGAAVHRRAPDAGLTGLGWLLVAYAMFAVTFLIPQLVFGDGGRRGMDLFELSKVGAFAPPSNWWSVALVAMQLWAGFELLRMGSMHKLAGTLYAVVAVAVSLYVYWPVMKQFRGMGLDPSAIMTVLPMAIQLVLPITTLILVNRHIAPTAHARFRARAE